jgi:hypothetical protein
MVRPHRAWFAIIIIAASTQAAAAQSVKPSFDVPRVSANGISTFAHQGAPTSTPGRDSLWNGTLIGAGAGAAAAATLDRVFCDSGDGNCDFPWKAYLMLGGIGAAAGAGIDFLIGRDRDDAKTALRLAPVVGPHARGVRVSVKF